MIRLATFDPGEKNFAVAVTEHVIDPTTEVHKSRVRHSGLLKSTITNLKNRKVLTEQALGLYAEIEQLFDTWGPFTEVGLERFQGRGMAVGTTSETTNIMIGVLAALSFKRYDTPFPTLLPASQWKNEYNKLPYSDGLNKDYVLCAATNHQLDAALIGHYLSAAHLGLRPFEGFADEAMRDKFMQWVEKASVEPLTKRRKQRRFYRREVD